MKKRKLLLPLVLTCTFALSACGSDKEAASSAAPAATPGASPAASSGAAPQAPALAPAKLKLVYYGDQSKRMKELLNAELKDAIKKEINAEVDFQYLPWSEYGGGKTDLMLASGEDFAAITDVNHMTRSVSKGFFTDLTPFMDKAAVDMKKNLDKDSFDAFKLNGKQYAVPVGNKPNAGEFYSVLVRQDLLEEAGMTLIKSLDDLEAYYDKIHAKHPDLIGYAGTDAKQMLSYVYTAKSPYWLNTFVMVDEKAKDDKVISWFESQEFKDYSAIMNKWYKKGIIPKYAATNQPQLLSDWNAGKAMFWAGTAARPMESVASITKAVPTAKVQNYFLADNPPKISRGTYSTAFFVSANAKDPERYVMLFNMLQKNQELYDLFLYGIKDKDYTLQNDRITRTTTDTLIDDWILMNKNFMRFSTAVSDKFIEEYKHWNDNAVLTKAAGFTFDNTAVKNEEAKLNGVFSEFITPISSGFVDYDSNFPAALKKLKDAGIDKYMAEYQKQFSEWYAKKAK